jgi:hypothetical protein
MGNHQYTKRSFAFLGAAFVLCFSGCNSNTNNRPWYDVYGHLCGNGIPGPGCDFYGDGNKIKNVQDPYYSNHLTLTYSNDWTYTDVYGYQQNYSGWAWLSPDGILYDSNGSSLNTMTQSDGHDLLGDAAAMEDQIVNQAGQDLAARYALSEATGVQIARTLNDWAVLGKSTARTDEQVASFTSRLYGVSASEVQSALARAQSGDRTAVDQVNARVAVYWGTNPETSAKVLKAWFQDEMGEFGLK